MSRKKLQLVGTIVGVALFLVAVHVITVTTSCLAAVHKLTLGMSEADVVAILGQPTQANDWHSAGGALMGRELSYHFPFFWDRFMQKIPGRLGYYNPSWVTVDFRQGSPTVTEILRHNAYQRSAIVVDKVDDWGASNQSTEGRIHLGRTAVAPSARSRNTAHE